jgi:predicted acylesterase/phospholipase RssA
MDMMLPEVAAASKPEPERALPGQVVVAFQGGGALNAYQGGVYQMLTRAESTRRSTKPGSNQTG